MLPAGVRGSGRLLQLLLLLPELCPVKEQVTNGLVDLRIACKHWGPQHTHIFGAACGQNACVHIPVFVVPFTHVTGLEALECPRP